MVGNEISAQASCARRTGQGAIWGSAMLVAAGWLMAGCSTLQAVNPVNWWHRQEGGKIAEQRPAPPGADQPYPNIATVPPKPDAPDAEALKKLTDSLVADRTNAQHAAQSAPLADPSSPTASPDLFGVGTAPRPPPPGPPGADVASASMPAVTAPPPPPAPRKTVQSAPLEALPAAPDAAVSGAAAPSAAVSGSAVSGAAVSSASASSAGGTGAGASAAGATAAAAGLNGAGNTAISGPLPALPEAPPPRPGVAGAAPVAAVVPVPMPPPPTGTSAAIVFPEQTASLSQPATEEVKAFASKRGNGTISVTGYGDSASSDPDAQSAALNLGLSRAQSIEQALKAAGVPGAAIRVSAEASGRGALLHLLQ